MVFLGDPSTLAATQAVSTHWAADVSELPALTRDVWLLRVADVSGLPALKVATDVLALSASEVASAGGEDEGGLPQRGETEKAPMGSEVDSPVKRS